jgi:hypothetical protein
VQNQLAAQPARRQFIIVLGFLPVLALLAVLVFTWPAARLGPRDLPVGIVGTSPASQRVVAELTRLAPGGFDFRLYADEVAARSAIKQRDVYGAFDSTADHVTVLEASAASPPVAQLLSSVGKQLAQHGTAQYRAAGLAQRTVGMTSADIVATSPGDPHGAVLSSTLLPLTIASVIIGSAIAMRAGRKSVWQIAALPGVCAAAGLGAYLIAQAFLGALPHQAAATWAALSLTMLAISASTAGVIALVGVAGVAVSALLIVFVGNAFSGVTSAPELLPTAVGRIGQALPPGAGANLLRSTAYFNGNGAAGHLTVLALWSAFGLTAIVVGHLSPIRFAASLSPHARSTPAREPDLVPGPDPGLAAGRWGSTDQDRLPEADAWPAKAR